MRGSVKGLPRRLLIAAVAAATVALSLATPLVSPAGAVPGQANAVVVAPSGTRAGADAMKARLVELGARVDVIFLPRTAAVRVSRADAARMRAAGYTVLRTGSAAAARGLQTGRALRLLRALRTPEATGLPPAEPRPLGRDVLHTSGWSAMGGPSALVEEVSGPLPGPAETSVFAAGTVAVSIIFPESTGAIDADQEDWSNEDPLYPGVDRRQLFTDKIVAACAWWAALCPGGRLTFVIPAPGTLGAPATIETPYEPESRSPANDGVWRDGIMAGLGFVGGHVDDPPAEQLYGDSVRASSGADWAVTVYAVDTLNSYSGTIGGLFGGAVAYTWSIYGPYMAVAYSCDGYTTAHADVVIAHELGHIFGALDEYDVGPDYPSWGDLSSGYLWVLNGNAQRGGTTNVPCIMRGGQEEIDAFAAGRLCVSTRGQAGWRDSDADGTVDVVDTQPLFSADPFTLAEGNATVSGVVQESAFPNGGPQSSPYFPVIDRDISIFIPRDVRYRLDGGAWQPATATDPDGLFDQWSEPFSVTVSGLTDGHHLLDIQAETGETALLQRHLWVGPTPVDLTLRSDAYDLRLGGQATLHLQTTGDGFPVPRVPDVQLYTDTGETMNVSTDDEGVWTGTIAPMHSTVYRARFDGAGQFQPAPRVDSVFIGVRANLTAHRLPSVRLGETMRIWGTIAPAQRAWLALERRRSDGQWIGIANTDSSRAGRYTFNYKPGKRGTVRLRVHFWGSRLNTEASRQLRPFDVR